MSCPDLDRALCAVYHPATVRSVQTLAIPLRGDPVWEYIHPDLDLDQVQVGVPVGGLSGFFPLPLAAVPVVLALAEFGVLLAEERGAPPQAARGVQAVLDEAQVVEDTLYRVTGPGRAAPDRPVTLRGAVEVLLDRGLSGAYDRVHLPVWVWRAAQSRGLGYAATRRVYDLVCSRELDVVDALAAVAGGQ